MDVVEKVQSVLKSAMGKPLSTLAGSHPVIPEKVNVEWSNILPAILAGDKYGNKVEESHHAERPTSPKPTSSVYHVIRNESSSLSSKSNTTTMEIASSVGHEDVKHVEEAIVKNERNKTQQATASIKLEPTTDVSYTEKLMIPVSVITTEQDADLISRYTTAQTPVFHKLTEIVPLEEKIDDEENLAPVNTVVVTKSTTTISASPPSSSESSKNDYHDYSTNEALDSKNDSSVIDGVTDSIDLLATRTKIKPISGDVPSKMETPSMNQVQTSITDQPFTTGLPSDSSSFANTKDRYNVTSLSQSTESSSIVHDTMVTKSTTSDHTIDGPIHSLIHPSSTEILDSLSNIIGQIFERIPSSSPSSTFDEFESISSETTCNECSTTSSITSAIVQRTTPPSVTGQDSKDGSNTFEERVQETTAMTTLKIDEENVSSSSIVSTNTTDDLQMIDDSDITTKSDIVQSVTPNVHSDSSNITKSTMNATTTDFNFNPLRPVEIIEDMLHTASTETSKIVTESLTLPNDLRDNLLPNTVASALIANLNSFNLDGDTSIMSPSPQRINSTDVSPDVSQLSSVTSDTNDATRENSTSENEIQRISTTKENLPEFSREDDGATSGITDRTVAVTRTNVESSHPQNELSVTPKSTITTTVSLSTFDTVVKNSVISETDTPLVNSASIEHTFNPVYEMTTISNNGKTKIPNVGKISEEVSQRNNDSKIESSNATEISSQENDKENTYRPVIIESSTVAMRPSNAENNSKDSIVQDSLKTETQQRNDTDLKWNTTLVSFNDTKSFIAIPQLIVTTAIPKVSLNSETSQSSSTITTMNPITKESNENKDITTSTTMNYTPDWSNKSENKTKKPNESYHNDVDTKASSMLQSKINSTNVNSQQNTWQRISLHQVTPSLTPTEFTATMKQQPTQSTPLSITVSTAAKTNSTEDWKTHFQSTPVNEMEESTFTLDASKSIGGLDISTRNASVDIINFSRLCNELAVKFWIAANSGLDSGRSLVLSPFGMISLLSMIFLGARGSTSDQMNEVLGLDNVATFNPHLTFQNVTDTVSLARNQGIANAAFVRELFADKAKVRRLLPFYKEQAQQFYEGLVAEVNFATISDLARRRTNLLIRKQTGGRIKDFVRSNSIPLRSPLAAISANVFQTDCNTSSASATGRDGELYFAVSSAHRLRKLIPVPATVWRSNVLAGYEPSLDATAIALGGIDKIVSTVFLVPGQQGHAAPGDTLDRLEQRLTKGAFQDGSWDKLLKVLIPRTGLELQMPKFSHRSIVNATAALKRLGLDQLFSNRADFKGINGIGNRLFLSDVLQVINFFHFTLLLFVS